MKLIIPVAVVVLGASAAFAFNTLQQSNLQAQQLADYESQVAQLLSQVETNSLRRLDYEKQIQQLQSQLTTASSQVTALSNQLAQSQNQVNPDYQQMEADIRQRVSREIQQQAEITNPRVGLVKQLTELDPMELGELMSLQSQFGGFLQSLDVDDERMEVIVEALSNLIADQNQRRRELAFEARSQQSGSSRQEYRALMRDVSSPEGQREALSYALTDAELNALAEFQQQSRRSGAVMRNSIQQSYTAGDTVILRQNGTATAEAIQIIPAAPNN